jgi:hypothetical protein
LNETEAETVYAIKENTKWGQFTEVLTAIALHQLHLPNDWFPERELKAAQRIKIEREQRVWNDILKAPHTPKSKSSNWRRIYIAKRMLKNSWKFNEYAEITAHELLFKELRGHLSKKKVFNL